MRLRQIEVFHAVYTAGSITNAAAVLHVSQPSVSKVLAHAEQQLGYALFERVKGKLIATPEAHRLFEHVAQVYEDLDMLRRVSLNLRARDPGLIRIAATPAFAVDLLPRAIASFRESHSNTVFEIETLHHAQINNALQRSQIDLGLAFDPIRYPGIALQVLATGECVLAASARHQFAGSGKLSLSDIGERPFIRLHDRGPIGRRLAARLAEAGDPPNTVAIAETYQVAKALVANGVGVAIIDEITARSSGHNDILTRRLQPAMHFEAVALHRDSEPLSVGARHFVEHLGSCFTAFLGDRVADPRAAGGALT